MEKVNAVCNVADTDSRFVWHESEQTLKDGSGSITASYATIEINMNGSFLKLIDLSIPKNGQTTSMKLTLG